MKIREGEPAVLLHKERPYTMGSAVIHMVSGITSCFVAFFILMLFSVGGPGRADVSSLERTESHTISVLEQAQESPGVPARVDLADSRAEASALDMRNSSLEVKKILGFTSNILMLLGIVALFKGVYIWKNMKSLRV